LAIPVTINEEIKNLNADVKAEAITYLLEQSGVRLEEILFYTNHFFYRNYSRDVYHTDIDDSSNVRQFLKVFLSRSGMYDVLPEGLFFQPTHFRAKPISATEMAEEYKLNKREEGKIRDFFSPLHNEFFYHKYKNFCLEKSLIDGHSNGILNLYFKRFWNFPKSMPIDMVLRFALLIPYIHQIAGDATLMGQSMAVIFNEVVICEQKLNVKQLSPTQLNQLGQNTLGNEQVCGELFDEEEVVFNFVIQLKGDNVAKNYLPNGKLYASLQTFYSYFVPTNALVETTLQVEKKKEQFILGETDEAYMGISTVI
jgi:hypothetical protein